MVTQQVQEDVLTRPIEGLERALATEFPGHEREWAEAVSEALTNVEQAMRFHAATAESSDGLLTKVDLTRPTLARQVAELRREHTDLVNQARDLQGKLRTAAQAFESTDTTITPLPEPTGGGVIPDFGALRQSTERLLAALQHHMERETGLIQESVNTDIGVGD
jgi:hypothetical protein